MYTYMITYRHTLSSQVHVFSSFCFEVAFASKYFCFLGIRSVFLIGPEKHGYNGDRSIGNGTTFPHRT